MKKAIVSGVTQFLRRGKRSFLRKAQSPQRYQEKFLFSLIRHHAETEFGQAHGFSEIQSIDAYRQQVPIRTYQDLEPWMVRMADGEENILIKDRPIYFNITSGSTGNRKLIPVTPSSRQCVKRASAAATGFLADAAIRRDRPLGSLLFPASMNSVGKTKSGIEFAPVSTSDLKLSNVVSRQVMSSPIEAHQIADLKSRHYVCLLFALSDENLRVLAETFPVTTLRLCQFMEKHSESLIHDLKTGSLTHWLQLTPEQRITLEAKLKPSMSRVEALTQILQEQGRLTPEYVWPHLSFLITARGGTSDFYFEKFPEYFGSTPIFGGVYSSAEATYGIHRDFNTDGVLLALESGFFEFIPEEQWDVEQPSTLLPWQVEVGKRYRIVVTNYNGFYRYDVGDVVEIEGFYQQTPIFIFRHRYKGFITSVGEKTTEYHVTKVISALQRKHSVMLENFCITLTDEIPPGYVVNIEIAEGQTLEDPRTFLEDYDEILQDVHKLYAMKRQDQVKPPILKIYQSGSFEQLHQALIKRGASETQIKLPKISNDRHLLSESTVVAEYTFEKTLVH